MSLALVVVVVVVVGGGLEEGRRMGRGEREVRGGLQMEC